MEDLYWKTVKPKLPHEADMNEMLEVARKEASSFVSANAG